MTAGEERDAEHAAGAERTAAAAAGLAIASLMAGAVAWFLAEDNAAAWWICAAAGAFGMSLGCSAGLRGSPIGWLVVVLGVPGVLALLVIFFRSVVTLAVTPASAVPDLAFTMLVAGGAMTVLHQSLRR